MQSRDNKCCKRSQYGVISKLVSLHILLSWLSFLRTVTVNVIVFSKPETAELRQQPKRGIMRTWIWELSVGLQRRGGRDPIHEIIRS